MDMNFILYIIEKINKKANGLPLKLCNLQKKLYSNDYSMMQIHRRTLQKIKAKAYRITSDEEIIMKKEHFTYVYRNLKILY